MLQGTTIASPPALRISAAASSQAGCLRDDTTTLAPCSARCRAIDLPMPLLEPVTTATLPDRSKSGDAMMVSSLEVPAAGVARNATNRNHFRFPVILQDRRTIDCSADLFCLHRPLSPVR